MKIEGSFQIASWDEDVYHEEDDGKLSLASVTQQFDGGIRGDGSARWLMAYKPDGTARFVGLQRIEADIDDRHGTIVLETSGDFDGQVARWNAAVVGGSGAGELAGASGDGTFEAPLGSKASFTLELGFDS